MAFERAGDRHVWSVEKVVHQFFWSSWMRTKIHRITSHLKFVTSVQEHVHLEKPSTKTYQSFHVNATYY